MNTTPATRPTLPAREDRSGHRCSDCGMPAPGNFCPECGQETHIETPTVRHLVHEFVDQFIALENTLGRTLRTLIAQPGELTLEYLRGRRQRYVRPFKLYLTVSVVFFSLVGLLPDSMKGLYSLKEPPPQKTAQQEAEKHPSAPPSQDSADEPAADETKDEASKPDAEQKDSAKKDSDDDLTIKPDDSATEKRAKSFARKMSHLGQPDMRSQVRKQLADEAPYAMFILMPYFALLLRWFYRKSGRLYGEHLLFSVHLHTFAFLLLTLGFIPLPPLHTALEWGLAAYVFFALRHFYGGGWKRTLWRMGLLYMFYFVAIAATAVSGVMAIVLGDS